MDAVRFSHRGICVVAALMLLPAFTGCGGCSKPPLPDPRVAEEEEEFVVPGAAPPAAAQAAATSQAQPVEAGSATEPAATASDAAATSGAAPAPSGATPSTTNSGQQRVQRPVTPDEEFVDPSAAAAASQAAQTSQSARPRDLATWTPEHFLSARRENDNRLADAVEALGQRSVGDGAAAALLIQLLQMSGSSGESGESDLSQDADLGRALIFALGATRTAIGRELIKQVLRGKAKTPFDDFALTSAAIQALADYPSPENEEILYVLLTRPEQVRPLAAGSGVTAEALREQCLAIMGPRSSGMIRIRLARHVVAPHTPPKEMSELLPLLLEPRLENLGAQVVLYGSERISDDVKVRVQNMFSTYSATTLDQLLGVPPNAATIDTDILDPRLFSRSDALTAAEALWGGTFAAAMALRVQGLKDVDEQREFLKLACNVPSPAVRSRLLAALEQRWLQSHEGFSAGRVEVQQIRDPGFLLVAKALPREDDPAKRRLDDARDEDAGQPAGDNPARTQAIERIKKERAAKYAWMDVGERFVRELNSRFHAAALAEQERALGQRGPSTVQVPGAEEVEIDPFAPQAEPGEQADEPSAESEAAGTAAPQLPIALHPGAKVAVEYHRSWPASLAAGGRSPPVTFLEAHYVRLEVDDRMGKLVGFYNRQLGRAGDHFVARGRWLENVVRDAETGRARSIDVLITRQVDEAAVARDVAERLIVELLVVEVPDPTRPAGEADDLAAEATLPPSPRSVP